VTLSQIKKIKGKKGFGKGMLKVKSISRPITFQYKIVRQKKKYYIKANFEIKADEFGIKDINYMGVGVENVVTIAVKIPIKTF